MVLRSCVGSIKFVHPANIRKAHKELMMQIRTEAIHIVIKYKIQIEPIQFEWDKFLPTLEKDFLDILNEVSIHNSNQQQLPNSNESGSTPSKNIYIGPIHRKNR